MIWLLLLLTQSVKADMIDLREVSIDYRNYFPGGRDPLITSNGLPNRGIGKGLDVNINSDILDWVYWNNRINSKTDYDTVGHGGQFRLVGWETAFGVHLSSYVDIGYYHHSQHILDAAYKYDNYPVEDAIQIKLYLYRSKKDKESVLP